MKLITGITICIALCIITCSCLKNQKMKKISEYKVVRLEKILKIDGIWDKPEWQTVDAVELKYFMGKIPKFQPIVKAKMMYDSNNLYIIFRVEDRYIRCVTRIYNGPVWEDSCVEFFFSPDSNSPEKYFNLEINCGGTPLMHYSIIPRKNFKVIEDEDIKQIEIAHSLPEIIDPEIEQAITWTLEYRIPLVILEKYSGLTYPKAGVVWRGNFYKIADKTSNVHYLTWSLVDQAEPDFHLPAYFGKLIFQ
jgi:hypothetical protein